MRINNKYLKFISGNIVSLYSADIFSYLLLAIFTIIYGRVSGPSLFGLFSLSFIIATLARTFSELGYDVSIPRKVANEKENFSIDSLYFAQSIKNNFWLIFFIPIVIIGYIFTKDWTFIILLFWNFFVCINSTYKSYLKGIQKVYSIPRIEIIFYIVLSGIGILLIFYLNKLSYIFILFLVTEILKSFAFHKHISKYLGKISYWKLFDFSSFIFFSKKTKNEVSSQIPLFVIHILTMFQYRIASLVLGYIGTNIQLGFYSGAVRFLTIARLLPIAFINFLIPEFSKLSIENRNNNIKYYILASLVIGILFGAFIYYTAEFWIILLLGNEYVESIIILQILGFTFIPVMLNFSMESFLIAYNYEKYVNIFMSISSVVILLLSVYILYYLDYSKLPYAVIIGDSVLSLLYFVMVIKIIKRNNK